MFESVVNGRVDIPEDIRRFQKTLQYAGSKEDYAIGESVYMLLSDMSLMIYGLKRLKTTIIRS